MKHSINRTEPPACNVCTSRENNRNACRNSGALPKAKTVGRRQSAAPRKWPWPSNHRLLISLKPEPLTPWKKSAAQRCSRHRLLREECQRANKHKAIFPNDWKKARHEIRKKKLYTVEWRIRWLQQSWALETTRNLDWLQRNAHKSPKAESKKKYVWPTLATLCCNKYKHGLDAVLTAWQEKPAEIGI